jgi:hypothetical protein
MTRHEAAMTHAMTHHPTLRYPMTRLRYPPDVELSCSFLFKFGRVHVARHLLLQTVVARDI